MIVASFLVRMYGVGRSDGDVCSVGGVDVVHAVQTELVQSVGGSVERGVM